MERSDAMRTPAEETRAKRSDRHSAGQADIARTPTGRQRARTARAWPAASDRAPDRAGWNPIVRGNQAPVAWADTAQTSAEAEQPWDGRAAAIAAPAMIDTAAADAAAMAIPLASTPALDSLGLLLTYLQASPESGLRPYPHDLYAYMRR